MSRRTSDLDEDDVRVRPGRSSRPRSRLRPAHDEATPAYVLAVDRGRFTCEVDDHEVTAVRARELGRKSVVVGDHVGLVGDVSGVTDTLARLIRIEPRTSVLRRSADDGDPMERIIVANAEQLAIVSAVANPEPQPRLIDRYLVAAFDGGLEPLLVLTKTDLADPAPLIEAYALLELRIVVTRSGQPSDELREVLRDRVTVLAGSSGVGKSTLINALVPGADRATGDVNVVTGRGRHVSTSAVVLDLPGGGRVIDTPGIRSFGLAHVDVDRVVTAFPDLAPGIAECPRGCQHVAPDENTARADQDGDEIARCALDDWVAAGHAEPARLDSLRRLLAARDKPDLD
ncbi:MAG TPA: ribosome small subunit-dependent GTPase A [Acidothermaceae bacterium]|nr:ribosome small subunit-dependent GTPase A [Acidothermaceae bacterium]